MNMAKTWRPKYKGSTLYGAVACLTKHAGSARMAENKGLFVIRATGKSAHLINNPGFKPVIF